MPQDALDWIPVKFTVSQLSAIQSALASHVTAVQAQGFEPSDQITLAQGEISGALYANRYTAFCQEADGTGTVWVGTILGDTPEAAKQAAICECANDWGCSPDDVRVLGLARGDVEILEWNDLEA